LEQLVDLDGLSKLEAFGHADPGTVFGVIEQSALVIGATILSHPGKRNYCGFPASAHVERCSPDSSTDDGGCWRLAQVRSGS
jgi:hypothetical protein